MPADLDDLSALVAVARAGGFRDAARQTGTPASNLSAAVRRLEARLGVRLLNRTTRSVGLTEVGERLLGELRPALDSFEAAMDSISAFRDQPTGTLRLTVPRPAAKQLIEPIISRFLTTYPAITLEVVTDSALTDIVRERFDAGIRPGHRVEQDMIAVRIGEDAQPTLVASPDYLERCGEPKAPPDLRGHNCIRLRIGGAVVSRWEFEKRGANLEVLVSGSLITTDGDLSARAALDGVGVARVPVCFVAPYLADGRLVALLEDWRPRSVGFYLYYPSRRQTSPALQALIAMFREEAR